jgi:hypothetical protein
MIKIEYQIKLLAIMQDDKLGVTNKLLMASDVKDARIAELEKELRIYDEAIRDCAIDRSLGGNRPVFEYIADARKNLSAPPEEAK